MEVSVVRVGAISVKRLLGSGAKPGPPLIEVWSASEEARTESSRRCPNDRCSYRGFVSAAGFTPLPCSRFCSWRLPQRATPYNSNCGHLNFRLRIW
jgi:hypothetical protein